MITKIHKWGNSLGLRIPKALARDVRVDEGADVEMTVEDGCLRIVPIRKTAFELTKLLEKVSPENLHGEVDTGAPVGREAW